MTVRIGDRVALSPGDVRPGCMVLEDGAWRFEEGEPGQRAGLAIPAPVNAHTHLGDTVARGTPVPPRLEDAVAPPHGLKHRLLDETPVNRVQEGIVHALRENCEAGTSIVVDFREGGVPGLHLLLGVLRMFGRVGIVRLGRPVDPTGADVEPVLDVAQGLGLSGLGDLPREVLELSADACRKRGAPLALHVSEARREDIAAALALEPAFLVHLVMATRSDLRRVADAGVTPVVCPRSNRLFGAEPPVRAMLAAGLKPALGTDNGWFHTSNVLEEVAYLVRELKFPASDALAMATWNGQALAKRLGTPVTDWVLLEAGPDDPLESVLSAPRVTWSRCWVS